MKRSKDGENVKTPELLNDCTNTVDMSRNQQLASVALSAVSLTLDAVFQGKHTRSKEYGGIPKHQLGFRCRLIWEQ